MAALSISACGSSSNGSAATTTGTSTAAPLSSAAAALSSAKSAAAAAVASATAGTGTGAAAFDVCTILPAAQAAQLSGQPYTQAVPTVNDGMSVCAYDNDDATVPGVNVEILDDPDGDTWSVVHVTGVTDISGLGDKALWDNDNTLYAVKGGYLVQVNGDDLTQNVAESMAEPVIAALP